MKLEQLLEKMTVDSEGLRVTQSQLDRLEKQLDKMYQAIDMDVEFTRHFIDRVNDARNKRHITIRELRDLFRKAFRKYKDTLKGADVDWQAVLTDLSSDVNVPFVIVWDDRQQELDLVSKTVMRKKNFTTSNKKLTVR